MKFGDNMLYAEIDFVLECMKNELEKRRFKIIN